MLASTPFSESCQAWVGLSPGLKTITSEPTVGKATPSTRAKWRSSRSACSGALEKCLTPPTLSETRCYVNNRGIAASAPEPHSALGLDRLSSRGYSFRLDRPHRFPKGAASRESPFFPLCPFVLLEPGIGEALQMTKNRIRDFLTVAVPLLSGPAHFGRIAAKYGP
jgi:hypothetical protein